ncbi:OLC1v1014934C1 [Oldenlandia corymbosa var. corymbosa]|uniref:OLC1v1014934C1 n=1 Tax=Oldenlandia corymbosa var. corymbosa TaxID=529605 RepID=A0AAV1E4A2_OLDCO|nr:OLC1v1014934C1 [Oldenlandia corymbosa var. corymbosa]
MGSSGEAADKSLDVSVGCLVWVRRRNGCWWPAQILSPEELPESSSVSEKLGTPVKLLGRDDSSVAWYNFEKSKRVKAFRCGEYDDCIEKAKAAASASSKVVKYARRDGAILHALEIENARLGNDPSDLSLAVDKKEEELQCENSLDTLQSLKDTEYSEAEQQMSFSKDDSDSDAGSASNSELEFSHSGVSFEGQSQSSTGKDELAEVRQQRTPNDSEDDGMEGIKRMKGLDDLGMGVVSSLKRKRSTVAHAHESLKRKSRRRTLSKVLESTAMVSVPVLCEQLGSPTGSCIPGSFDNKISGLDPDGGRILYENGDACESSIGRCTEKENGISGLSGCPENDSSDSLYDVPLIAEEKDSAVIRSATQKGQGGCGTQSSQSSQVETASLGNDELIESGSASSGAADINILNSMLEKGASEWQLKGKRNSRHTSKNKRLDTRFMDVDKDSSPYLRGMDQDAFTLGSGRKAECNSIDGASPLDNRVKSRTVTDIHQDDFRGWSSSLKGSQDEDLPADLPPRSQPLRMSRFVLNPKYDSSDFSLRHHIAENSLYDVNVEVKGSYRPQHVPYISLMSKLNGQPIVGHPLTVDVLEDGASDHLMSSSECYSSSYELDDDHGDDPFVFDTVYERRSKSGGRRGKKYRKTWGSPSKLQKSRKNGALSKKIRRLSSLTSHKHGNNDDKKPMTEKLKGPAVACVPLKVVFSRINASLNCSIRPTQRLLPPASA